MKSLTFCFHFLRKNLISVLLSLLILTFTFFYLITLLGKVQYKLYVRDIMAESGLEDALYAMPFNGEGASAEQLQEQIARMDGVSGILTFRSFLNGNGKYPVNVFCYSDGMIGHFRQNVKKGRWLDCGADSLEAVIGGAVWPGVRVGDLVTLDNGLTCRVVGILPDTAVYPSFSRYSNTVCPADYLFKAIDNVLFLNERALGDTQLTKYEEPFLSPNFFVEFREDASPAERDAVVRELQNAGMVWTFQEIGRDSEKELTDWIRLQFPLPLFLLLIATVNMVSICAVMLHRSLPDLSKFYLLGCTRRYAAVHLTAGMGILFSLPAALNILLALLRPHFIRRQFNGRIYDYLIDLRCLIPVAAHMVFLLLIVGLLNRLSFRTYSPFDFYRRNL